MKHVAFRILLLIFAIVAFLASGSNLRSEKNNQKTKGISPSACYDCHEPIKDLYKTGKHLKF